MIVSQVKKNQATCIKQFHFQYVVYIYAQNDIYKNKKKCRYTIYKYAY